VRITGFAEIVLRVTDLERMTRFYQDVVGLAVWKSFPGFELLRVGPLDTPLGRGGHPQLLGLVDREVNTWTRVGSRRADACRSTLDHLAFEIPAEDFDAARERLEGQGLATEIQEFPFMAARALFFDDPEGNVVELICHAPDLPE
jgi:catechol 2,3-dioxygenase-like lactoylglutathione lyase family enzyme